MLLERKVVLAEALDGLIEQCRRGRLSLGNALAALLPRACELMDARGAFVRAVDEQLEQKDFSSGDFPAALARHVPATLEGESVLEPFVHAREATLVLRRLDCADMVVGIAAFAFPPGLEGKDLERARDEVRTAAETIDNYLEGIAAAARKQRLSVSASAALRSAVLEEGADRAIALLSSSLGLEEVALVFGDEGCQGKGRVHYRLYRQGDVVADSVDRPDARFEGAIQKAQANALDPENRDLMAALGGPECVETALINGLVDVSPVGKLVVRNAVGNLSPEGMDVLRIFAECLSQRLVDYNRERRHLSQYFAHDVVTRLVRGANYERKWLRPRVEPVAILFSDIAGFTAICDQVLGDAQKIGELIDTWSEEAVRILHEHGGVFDKLVGDCVIGLFGPPFYEDAPGDRVARAVRAARAIADMTRRLGAERGYDAQIVALGINAGLATTAGVGFGPTSVGLFGPNQDFTGFSSHVNNTARLQGLAKWGEVLVIDAARSVLGERLAADGIRLEGPEQAKVKNVKEPIAYFRAV